MANTNKTAGSPAKVSKAAPKVVKDAEVEVRIAPVVQKAVKALALAHEQEKVIDAILAENRKIILDALGKDQTRFGVDARGKRLVKVQLVIPKDPTRYDTAELVAFLAKTQPELLEMFRAEDAKPTARVLTLN